jgi:TP901 family phage tail tape measure protein/lambda family phage tail tape measure protein
MPTQDYGIQIKLDTGDFDKSAAKVGQSLDDIGGNASGAQEGVDKLQASLRGLGNSTVGDVLKGLGGGSSAERAASASLKFSGALKDVAQQAAAAGSAFSGGGFVNMPTVFAKGEQAAAGFLRSLGQIVVASGVFSAVSSFGSAIKSINEFEEAFKKVGLALDLSSAQLDRVKEKALQVSAGTSFSTTQIAQGLEVLGRAGIGLGISFQTLKPTIDLATAAQLNLGKSAEITAKIIADAEVPLGRLTETQDRLLAASRTVGGDIGKLGDVFGKVYPQVKAYGASIDEAVALSVLFAARGVGATQAVEQIQKAFKGITDETEDFKKKFEDAGAKIADFDPRANSLSKLFDDLASKGVKLDDTFRFIGTKQGAEAFTQLLKLLSKADGQVKQTIDKTESGYERIKRSLTELKNTIDSVINSIGAVGGTALVEGAFRGIAASIRTVASLIITFQPLIIGVGVALAVAFAPAILEGFIGLLGQAIVQVRVLTAALYTLALSNPWTAILVGIGAVIGGVVAFSDKIVINSKIGTTLADLFQAVGESIAEDFAKIGESAVKAFNTIEQNAKSVVAALKSSFGDFFSYVSQGFNTLSGALSGLLSTGTITGAGAGAYKGFYGIGAPSASSGGDSSSGGILDRADEIAKKRQLLERLGQEKNQLTQTTDAVKKYAKAIADAADKDGKAAGGKGKKEKDYYKEELERLEDYKKAEERITAINKLFDEGKISVDKYNDRLQELRKELLKYDQTLTGGLQKGLNDVATGFTKFGDHVGSVVKGAFDKMTDAIVNFAKTGKFAWKDLVNGILESLLKLSLNALFGQFAQGLLGGLGGGKNLAGSGIQLGNLGKLFGFATGGSFSVGGVGGTDSQLVAFKATPGEMVNVKTPDQQKDGEKTTPVTNNVSVPVRIINSLDSKTTLAAMGSREGETLILNTIQGNASTLRKVLGIN